MSQGESCKDKALNVPKTFRPVVSVTLPVTVERKIGSEYDICADMTLMIYLVVYTACDDRFPR